MSCSICFSIKWVFLYPTVTFPQFHLLIVCNRGRFYVTTKSKQTKNIINSFDNPHHEGA